MRDYIGKICPYCKTAFTPEDDVVMCSACEMPHHKDCWIENRGCTTFGCTGTIENLNFVPPTPPTPPTWPTPPTPPVRPVPPTPPARPTPPPVSPANRGATGNTAGQDHLVFCTRCGAQNSATAAFCGRCGTRRAVSAIFCTRCGTRNPGTAAFCSRCGNRLTGAR